MSSADRSIFDYVHLSKRSRCTHVQPWAAHFHPSVPVDEIKRVAYDPAAPGAPPWYEPPTDHGFLREVRESVADAGMAIELIAVDRASVYWPEPNEQAERRERAERWLEVAAELGAVGIRVDSGGPPELDEVTFATIVDGYEHLVGRAAALGVDLYLENHWGASSVPENITALLDRVEGLRYLFDTNNWQPGRRRDGWRLCGPRADSTHIKSFGFDERQNPLHVDLAAAIAVLRASGYSGVWGVESFPSEQDELMTAEKTLRYIEAEIQAGAV